MEHMYKVASGPQFERQGIFSKIFNKFFLIPIFNLLPSVLGRFFITRSSKTVKGIYDNAKNSRALEYLYNFDGKITITGGFIDSVFTFLWQHNFINAKAARNRFKLVEAKLYKVCVEVAKNTKGHVRIFSLASGSARVVLKVASRLRKDGVILDIKLLDLDPKALELSKSIASAFNVLDLVSEICVDKVSNFEKYCEDWVPDVIEMVGFMDYLTQEKAILLAEKVHRVLPDKGYFVTCNIKDNYERKFVTDILKWDMIYRDEDMLLDVMLKGGFALDNCELIYEPYLIHGLAIGKK